MTPIDQLQLLCAEAAEMFGNDWQAVNNHIAEKLVALAESDRVELVREINRVLAFQAPANNAARQLQ